MTRYREKISITAHDRRAVAGDGAGQEFVVVSVARDGFGERRGNGQISVNGQEIEERLEIEPVISPREFRPHAPVLVENLWRKDEPDGSVLPRHENPMGRTRENTPETKTLVSRITLNASLELP